ncbi:BTB domain containing protein [Pandoravirus dulcis]|uniref:BTB domain containing protein n=1 Tax=Pandoravirus dulcis TaxID=1349409 RepID=S4VRA1_9VIRU|nr:BTB domain containing protein [Pandoravirus dulcis]AGO82812.1 BTB domain containing protein [Pandoravirus dulcis]
MYKQLLVPQRERHDNANNGDNMAIEPEMPTDDDRASEQSSRTRGTDHVLTLDVGGTIVRTNARTLLSHGCSAALARDIEEQRANGPGVHPIFIDCDPKDFMLMLNFFRYGPAYIDADTLAKIGRVMAYLGMTSCVRRAMSHSVPPAEPMACHAVVPRLCDDECARVHTEMQQLLSFILAVDYDKARRAVERYADLDALLYPRSADGTRHLTEDDMSHAHAEIDRLAQFIVDGEVHTTPVDEETKAWATRRYRHIEALLAESLPASTQTAAQGRPKTGRSVLALPPRQQTALFIGVLFLVPVIVSAVIGSQRTAHYRC